MALGLLSMSPFLGTRHTSKSMFLIRARAKIAMMELFLLTGAQLTQQQCCTGVFYECGKIVLDIVIVIILTSSCHLDVSNTVLTYKA